LVKEPALPCLACLRAVLTNVLLNRYATLPNIMKAKKKVIDVKEASSYGINLKPSYTVLRRRGCALLFVDKWPLASCVLCVGIPLKLFKRTARTARWPSVG
jgi:hypothetical protein